MAEMVAQDGDGDGSETDETQHERSDQAARCPAIARTGEDLRKDTEAQPLNEVSQLTELAAMRMLLTSQGESGEE